MAKAKSEKLIELLLNYGDKVQNSLIYIMAAFALVGGALFLCGIVVSSFKKNSALTSMSDDTALIVVGIVDFAIFFPLCYTLCLLKICSKQQKQIDELNKKIESAQRITN